MALVECPECGQQISDKTKACVHCGVALKRCEVCGKMVFDDATYCPHCGIEFQKTSIEIVEKNDEVIQVEQISKEEQERIREFSALREKWERDKKPFSIIQTIIMIVCIIAIIGFIIDVIVVGIKLANTRTWSLLLEPARWGMGVVVLEFVQKTIDNIGKWILESKRCRDVRLLGKEKYFAYLRGHSLISQDKAELEFYNQVEAAAMLLEIPQERGKNIFSYVWSIIVHTFTVAWWLVFIPFFTAYFYQNLSSGFSGIVSMLFGDMLGVTLIGIALLGCDIASRVIKSKQKERQAAWRKVVRAETQEVQQG